MALLAKQLDVRPTGWEAAAGDYAEEGSPVGGRRRRPGLAGKVREFKKQKKAAAKASARSHLNVT